MDGTCDHGSPFADDAAPLEAVLPKGTRLEYRDAAGGSTGGRDLSGYIDRHGNISADVTIGGKHDTGANGTPAMLAAFLRDLAADVERAAVPPPAHGRQG